MPSELDRRRVPFGAALFLLAVAVVPASLAVAAGKTTPSATDVTRLPLGDGQVSSSPRRGFVYACRGPGRPGGPDHGGPWIHGSTFDLTEKAVVDGRVRWPGTIRFALTGTGTFAIAGNGLPKSTLTGRFPIAAGDDAYAYDRNPNRIRRQTVAVSLPARPRVAARASCLPMGTIGIAVNGVAIFNALDDSHRDAVAHETQDLCGGHPQRRGIYHYHAIPSCLAGSTARKQQLLVGYALDGFPILGPRGENGKLLTNARLDACHGHVGRMKLHGKRVRSYHYHATLEYPYTLGCFRGTPTTAR